MKILRRIYYLLCQRHLERDLAEEIEFHREISGNLREMGNITRAREDARAVWIWPWLQSVWQDATYAIRNLRHQPGFALLALASLGAAIGINTSLFTVFNALALRPWPVKDPARVVKVFKTNPVKSLPESRALRLRSGVTSLLTPTRFRGLQSHATNPSISALRLSAKVRMPSS